MFEGKSTLEQANKTATNSNFEKDRNTGSLLENTNFEDVLLNLPEEEKTTDELENTSLGDLYVLGKLWIEILQTGLLGTKWNLPPLLPAVHAAPPPPPPNKPPRMKYKDLPLYTSPHYEYRDYLEDQGKAHCPEYKRRLMHEKVLPCVKSYRKEICQNYTDFVEEFGSMKKEALANFTKKKNEFFCYMRRPSNIKVRQGVLALGGITGFLLGRRYKDKTSPKVFFTVAGLLAAGALCFPKETDLAVRNISMATGKFLSGLYNKFCSKSYSMRERIACKGDLPEPSPRRTPNKCD